MIKKDKVQRAETPQNISVLDLNYLNECFDNDNELKINVINVFLEQSNFKIDELTISITEKNYTEIKNISHFLKSSFVTMGLKCYKQLIELEALGIQKGPIEKIRKNFDEMIIIYNAGIKEYQSLLKNLEQS